MSLTHQTPTSYSFHKIALLLKSDVQIYAVGAKIEAFINVGTHGGFVSFEGCTNATVVGGEWLGDKSLHVSLPAGEFCFAFFINAAKRCGIWDAVIRDSRGDGIYVGGTPTALPLVGSCQQLLVINMNMLMVMYQALLICTVFGTGLHGNCLALMSKC